MSGLTPRLPLTGHSALTVDTILPTIGDAALGIMTVGAYSAALETQAGRIVNVVIDKISAVSQEATWVWWNRSAV